MANSFFEQTHIIHMRHRWLNNVHTTLLVGGSLALLAISAWAIGGMTGVFYAVAFGAISLFASRRVSPAMVLRMYKAKPVNAREFPVGHQIMRDLADRADLAVVPKLHVVPSKMMNAFAVGRQDESAVAVTDALVRNLTARELAGVLAHEVTHIKNEDVKVMSVADMVSRFTSTLSTLGMLALVFNVSGFFQVSWLGIAAMIFAPTIGGLLQMALSRTREFDADYGAALLTGDPDGLSMALRKLEKFYERKLEGMMLPAGRIKQPSMLRSHPPTDERIARLDALKETLVAPPSQAAHPVPRRASSIPKISPRLAGKAAQNHHAHWMSVFEENPVAQPLLTDKDADQVSCEQSLNPHEPHGDKPRIRITRGGVWW